MFLWPHEEKLIFLKFFWSSTQIEGGKNIVSIVRIKKLNTLDLNFSILVKSSLWAQGTMTSFGFSKFVGSISWPRVDHDRGYKWSHHLDWV